MGGEEEAAEHASTDNRQGKYLVFSTSSEFCSAQGLVKLLLIC
jgi:hypothetical protein